MHNFMHLDSGEPIQSARLLNEMRAGTRDACNLTDLQTDEHKDEVGRREGRLTEIEVKVKGGS